MRLTRKQLVLGFLAFGFTLHFVTRFALNESHLGSRLLSPVTLVLFGPIDWLQQDPDPPPPFRLILCAAYWSLLALGVHRLLSWKHTRA